LRGGLLGFVVTYQIEGKAGVFWTVAMCVVGIGMSAYTWYRVEPYGIPIRTGWNRTHYIRPEQLQGGDEVWTWADKTALEHEQCEGYATQLPRFVQGLQLLAIGYGVVA
jgi:hypothetical protein